MAVYLHALYDTKRRYDTLQQTSQYKRGANLHFPMGSTHYIEARFDIIDILVYIRSLCAVSWSYDTSAYVSVHDSVCVCV